MHTCAGRHYYPTLTLQRVLGGCKKCRWLRAHLGIHTDGFMREAKHAHINTLSSHTCNHARTHTSGRQRIESPMERQKLTHTNKRTTHTHTHICSGSTSDGTVIRLISDTLCTLLRDSYTLLPIITSIVFQSAAANNWAVCIIDYTFGPINKLPNIDHMVNYMPHFGCTVHVFIKHTKTSTRRFATTS